MKMFAKTLIAILVLLIVGIGCLFFFLSPLPYSFYNSVIKPSGIVSKNTLISYDNLKISSSFVDSIKLSEFDFLRKPITLYDSIAKEYYPDIKIIKTSVKVGSISINSQDGTTVYEYPDIIACIANKSGDLIYGLDLCMNNCDNFMNSNFNNLKASSTIDILASLDGMKYYNEGGYSELSSYPSEDFSSASLSNIYIYPRTYYWSFKGNMPYTCSDFYKNKSKPIKIIKIQ